MSKNYTHLSLQQRYQIEALQKAGISRKAIAVQIGVHPSTVSRELKRNSPSTGYAAREYIADKAQRRTSARHRLKPKMTVFTAAMQSIIVKQLQVDKWSPELITQIGRKSDPRFVSHEWIYQWIWRCKRSLRPHNRVHKLLYQHLRHGKRRNKRGLSHDRRGVIQNRTPIELRPAVVKKRSRLGDLEVDLMLGLKRKEAVLIMTDRCSLHTSLVKLKDRTSKRVKAAIIKELSKSPYKLHTLTFDNDQAFAEHLAIAEALNVTTYFTRPYTSQDKGTVENRIGVIRRFIPKGTDLRFVTASQVAYVKDKINNRPVRKFNYLTANQVLQGKIALMS